MSEQKQQKSRAKRRHAGGMPKGHKTRKVQVREAAQRQYLEREALTAERVLEELRRLAFADLREFFDATGNLKPMGDLTSEQGAVLASFEVIKKNAEAGDGNIDTIHKIRVWDKTRALEALAKHFRLLTEKIDHSGSISFRWLSDADG